MKKITFVFLVFMFIGCSGPMIYVGPDETCIDKIHEPETVSGTYVDGEDFIIIGRDRDSSLYKYYYVPESVYNSIDIHDEINLPGSYIMNDTNNYTL